MKVIGLTGGIGSGKTTVANMFAELGVPVFIADVEAKRLMNSSKIIRRKLIKNFGEQAYIDNILNRPYIANLVFNDKTLLQTLNSIVHPKVHQSFKRWLKKQNAAYVIYEAAIIFELGRESEFDQTILVVTDFETKLERLIERDNSTRAEVESRMNNQWTDHKKIPLATYVITNKTLKDTQLQVRKIHDTLT